MIFKLKEGRLFVYNILFGE